jgi:hypothetical protein
VLRLRRLSLSPHRGEGGSGSSYRRNCNQSVHRLDSAIDAATAGILM